MRTFGAVKGKIGEITDVGAESIRVTAQGGQIEIAKVKPEEGKKVSAAEWAKAAGVGPGHDPGHLTGAPARPPTPRASRGVAFARYATRPTSRTNRRRQCPTRSDSTRPAAPKSCSGRKSPSATPAPARRASASRPSASTTSTPTTAAACTRCRCPRPIGREGAGVVEAVGAGVTDLKAGDRVAWTTGPLGTYAEVKIHPAERLVKLPDAISFEQAACMMLQGLTVQYLLRRTYPVKAGETILFHAAAGGVGLIACQWAKALGANLIGTVGSEEKAAHRAASTARAHDHLHEGGLPRPREGDHRRQGRARRLRLDRQGHLHEVARLPAAARPHGELRQRHRPRRRVQPRRPRGRRARST